METIHDELVLEQKKTNELLGQLLHEQAHKRHQETRRFWLGLVWQILPVLIIGFIMWSIYQYMHGQLELLQTKFSDIQNSVSSFSIGNKLKSFL